MCGPWRYALGVSIFIVFDHETCAAGGSTYRGQWWAMVDEVTISERRDTIRDAAFYIWTHRLGTRKYSIHSFAVRGFEAVYMNWDIHAGCLKGGRFGKDTRGAAAEEVGRSVERVWSGRAI